MRVKCVSDKDSFLIEYKNITVGKDYEVIGVSEDYSMGTDIYTIVDDNGLNFAHGISIFRLIKEDKMEEIRVVRKQEDLKGMENGFGLTIDENLDVVRKGFNGYYLRREELLTFEGYLGAIKCMGFKFEYKPLRSLEEVIEEMRVNSLNPADNYGKEIFEVRYVMKFGENKGSYKIIDNVLSVTIGAYVFDEKTAQKYADELNEIINSK